MENNNVLQDTDKEKIIDRVKNYTDSNEVIELVKNDLDAGLSEVDVAIYYERKGIGFTQMQLLSNLLKKPDGRDIIKMFDENGKDYSRLSVAYEFLEKGLPVADIIETFTKCRNACDLKKLYSQIFSNLSTLIVSEPEPEENVDKEYVSKIVEEIKSVIKEINFHQDKYDVLNKKLDEIAVAKEDEMVRKNLVNQNADLQNEVARLTKENKDFTIQLEAQQNKLNEANSALAKKRNNEDDSTKVIDELKVKINELEVKIAAKEEVISNLKDVQTLLAQTGAVSKAKESTVVSSNANSDTNSIQNSITNKNTDSEDMATEPAHRVVTRIDDKDEIDVKSNEQHAVSESNNQTKEVAPFVYAENRILPVYYTLAVYDGTRLIQERQIDVMERKTKGVISNLVSKISFKKKSRQNFVKLVTKEKLSAEQIDQIRIGFEKGLDEDQLENLVSEKVSPEKMRSVIEMAVVMKENCKDGDESDR